MMRIPQLLIVCLAPWALSFGQLEISASLPVDTYLQFERVPLELTITNQSGGELRFGGETSNAQVFFQVKDKRLRVIPRTDKPLFPEPWEIAPGETSSRTFDLVQLHFIREETGYRVTPRVVVDGADSYTGETMKIDVRSGTLHAEIKHRRTDRTYSLIGINRNRRDELMLRVSTYDKDRQLATYFLEKHLRLYPPHMLINSKGYLATLHYDSPYRVVLCRFNPDGTPINRSFFKTTPGVPVRLHRGEDNEFRVEGGTPIEVRGRE